MTAAAIRRHPATAPDTARQPQAAHRAPADVPDWSQETLDLLARLTPLERGFVEHYASGCNGAEAYRRASGREAGADTDTSRQLAYKIKNRPRVRAALQAALADRNVGARVDREWIIQKLHSIVCKCEESGSVRAMNTLATAIRLMARVQGELDGSRQPPPSAQAGGPGHVRRRIEEIIADVERLAAERRAEARTAAAQAATSKFRTMEGEPCPAGAATPVSARPRPATDLASGSGQADCSGEALDAAMPRRPMEPTRRPMRGRLAGPPRSEWSALAPATGGSFMGVG
jgi:Terminase small subunit